MNSQSMKNGWWLWLLPSIVLIALALLSCSSSSPILAVVSSLIGGILASVGLSQALAGKIKWWVMLVIYLGYTVGIGLPLGNSGIREAMVLRDYLNVAIGGPIIGIPIVNSYRKRKLPRDSIV